MDLPQKTADGGRNCAFRVDLTSRDPCMSSPFRPTERISDMANRSSYYAIRKSKDDKFYYALVASNGEDLAVSEMYASKQNAERGIEAAMRAASGIEIKDET